MAISKVMQERYGPDSVALVVDEGFTGISFEYGSTVASFGTAEKGSVNVNIKVETLGGHSSVPPAHTGST
jgi:Gly-Xaa carboxypeptidase